MSKAITNTHYNEEAVPDIDLQDEDYCFVIGPNGELKSVFLPAEDVFAPPENIQKILSMYGIVDIDNICKPMTIH